MQKSTRNEVAFIDSNVDGFQSLMKGLETGVEPVVLSDAESAFAQIAKYLESNCNFDGVHIVAHGSPGLVEFAAGAVELDTLAASSAELERIRQTMKPGAALYLWSCETGGGESGMRFVTALTESLARPVAAASGKIGAAHLGGTWNLDQGPAACASSAFTQATKLSYQHVLASSSATTAKDTIVQTSSADTLIVTNTNQIQSTDSFDGSSGIDTILISGAAGVVVDLSAAPPSASTGFRNYEGLSFDNSSGTSGVTLNASQIAAGYIAPALAVTGAAGTQNITVNNAANFSAAAWNFASWTPGTDRITINGTTSADTITGSTQADTLDGGAGVDTLAGGLGNDAYIVDNIGDVVNENLGEGTDTVQSTVTYTLGANIENLTLAGAAAVSGTGNSLANTITGNNGNNTLDGGAGADTLTGGLGNDTYVVDNVGDVVTENVGEGTDTVQSAITYTLGANIENLTLTGSAAINGSGNTFTNTITGNGGDNILDGGAGADILVGGLGNDTYIVDNAGDVVTENVSEGSDTVQSSVNYALSANIENLTLTGAAAINGTGNTLANIVTGNSGDNILDGGAGADILVGGLGNDTYIVDNAGDMVTENAGEGTDTVQSAITYTLGNEVENLVFTGSAAINGSGNAGDNVLTGNSAANVLTGLGGNDTLNGGAGADTLVGGLGDDTYIVDNAADVVTENVGEGNDTVQTSVSFTLGANIENLTLTGAAAINGTGNALANIVTGNSGNNTLDGGAGSDTLVGGLGNDIYIVDNADDVVTENAGEGTDTVQSAITYTLGNEVENLVLTGPSAINGTGNTLANNLTGNSGNNILDGAAGADRLKGGLGNDTYIVDDAGDLVIENAAEGTDTIQSIVSLILGANIENLTLTGADAINGSGNTLANIVAGNSGDNVLDGAAGADTLKGGLGNDTYVVDNIGDIVTENVGEGADIVQSTVSYTLGANIENLTLTGSAAINGIGNSNDNVILGNISANLLDGGTGADALAGGLGNDTYVIDNVGDNVTENADEGNDTVQASVSQTIGAYIENLTLTGSAAINGSGNDSDNVLTGNSAANVLTGLGGNDTLNGGTGADTLVGGLGDDTYVVDNAGDVVVESIGEGIDTVQSSLAYTLGVNIENLTLLGAAAIAGTGNTLDNIITGNAATNKLVGYEGNDTLNGGAGIDTMIGGVGDDTYFVDNKSDVVTELAGEGIDTVNSSITYILKADFENLTLLGKAAINATGNAFNNILVGNTGNNVLNGGLGADTMSGGSGNDTYVIDDIGDVVSEIAGEGTDTVQSSLTFMLADAFENLTLTGLSVIDGTGNDLGNVLTGNAANNALMGLQGNDTLNGGLGADTLIGGLGNDIFVVDNVGDVVVEIDGEGTDTVQSSIAYVLDATLENLTLTGSAAVNGSGNAFNNVLLGNSGVNTLTGFDGNDTLNGGAGADRLIGGKGDDTYVVDNVGDLITENADEGFDTVESSATFILSANLEKLTLTGSQALNGTGNALDNVISGNSGINHLYGMAGNDTLSGGSGADFLVGGSGDDFYIVDNTADAITELAGEGIDNVKASVSYTLSANVENLSFSGYGAYTGTGNALDNIILGNDAVSTLYGMGGNDWLDGGGGADKLFGGIGNDTYIVDNAGDIVTENAGEGTDLVQSFVSFTLSANVDNLTLTGTRNVSAYGNADSNILIGNAGNNILDGAAGADQMVGGGGNDSYVVDNVGDLVIENAGEGTDIVRSSITHTLGSNVENLTLTGIGSINGTGNAFDNVITGNDSANTLMGGGGNDVLNGGGGDDILIGGDLGDVLTGGAGNDRFVFTSINDSSLDSSGVNREDFITDFTVGDRIDLSLIDANLNISGDQAFVLDTDDSYSVGEITITNLGDRSYVIIDVNDDNIADMAFMVQYSGTLTAADFIF
jgi:Ca2+-binding RTX toxin-like protein